MWLTCWTNNKQNNPKTYGWLHHLHVEFNKESGFNEDGYSAGDPDNYGYSNPKDYFNKKEVLSVFLKRHETVGKANGVMFME